MNERRGLEALTITKQSGRDAVEPVEARPIGEPKQAYCPVRTARPKRLSCGRMDLGLDGSGELGMYSRTRTSYYFRDRGETGDSFY